MRAYYAALSTDYGRKIRQLVPRYDEIVETIMSLLASYEPRSVVDLGMGAGNLTRDVVDRLPETQVIGIETCEEMVAVARRSLHVAEDRVRIVHSDIRHFAPDQAVDAVYTNLVLHNLEPDDRRHLLARIHDWLEPTGVFIWGDLIRHPDHTVQQQYVWERVEHARASGCDDELIRQSFFKEEHEDKPWTVAEMLAETGRAGFARTDCVWCHDTFCIVLAASAR